MNTRETDVRDFGAVGDGATLCHEAIQEAIDRCAQNGGGTVVVPPGTYLCGTLHLRSHVELRLTSGAVILSADRKELFPEICKTPYGNLPGQIQALIWAEGVESAAVTGLGAVDGAHPEALSGRDAAPRKFRPALIFCRNCRDLRFQDVTLRSSDFWTLHLQRCDGVTIRGVSIFNNRRRINADGIDPDGCRNVTISDCRIVSGDDCICLKSTEGDACENITIANCILSTTCAAIKLGTEAIGPVRNVTVTNCVIHDSEVGIALYMKDGSVFENIVFANLVVESAGQFPILLDVTPRYHKEPKKGRIESVAFDNIMVKSPGRFFVEGLPDRPVCNLSISNVNWTVTGPIVSDGIRKPSGARRTDPDPSAPNYAAEGHQLVVVNARNINVNSFRVTGPDEHDHLTDRGRYYLKNVEHGTISGFSRWASSTGGEAAVVEDCTDLHES